MALQSKLFRDDANLQACLVNDSAHVTPGARGEHVSKLQKALDALGDQLIAADEIASKTHGVSTASAVLSYKRNRNIINFSYQTQADNIVGKMTIASLDKEMQRLDQTAYRDELLLPMAQRAVRVRDMAKPDTPWFDRTRAARQLSVFKGSTVTGVWVNLLPRAIVEFNKLSNQLKFGVTVVSSTDAPDEAENSFTGADIRFETGEKFQFKASGQKLDMALEPLARGLTRTLAWDFGKGPQIRKACILMKPNPMADDFPRRVGDPVLISFTVHEFIHALGLHDHTPGGGDLLQDIPQIRTGARDKPDDDRLEVIGGKKLPPLFLLAATVGRIQALWPSP